MERDPDVVDWENFTMEYPQIQGAVQDWQKRLAAALQSTFNLF
jgi:hypothetical protein